MPVGEAFTQNQREEISRVLAEAEGVTGWAISVEVGESAGASREYAESLHASLPEPARSVLIQVDPGRRTLEIVTGSQVRHIVDNRSAALVAVTMQSAFAAGDLTRGLQSGIRQLAGLAQRPKTLHADTP